MVSTKKKASDWVTSTAETSFLQFWRLEVDMSTASSWPEYGGHFILVIPLCASVSQPPLIETPIVSD